MLGGHTPRTQITVNLIINIVTLLASSLLLGFLKGYYDSLYVKTGEAAPRIIYWVYLFLGLVIIWQLLSMLINKRLKRKLGGWNKSGISVDSNISENVLLSQTTQRSLQYPDFDNIGSASVNQETTKILDKSARE